MSPMSCVCIRFIISDCLTTVSFFHMGHTHKQILGLVNFVYKGGYGDNNEDEQPGLWVQHV